MQKIGVQWQGCYCLHFSGAHKVYGNELFNGNVRGEVRVNFLSLLENASTGVWCVPGFGAGSELALEPSKLQKEGANRGEEHFYFLVQKRSDPFCLEATHIFMFCALKLFGLVRVNVRLNIRHANSSLVGRPLESTSIIGVPTSEFFERAFGPLSSHPSQKTPILVPL